MFLKGSVCNISIVFIYNDFKKQLVIKILIFQTSDTETVTLFHYMEIRQVYPKFASEAVYISAIKFNRMTLSCIVQTR